MRKLILGDAELVEGQLEVIPTMEGIIEELKEYCSMDSYATAIVFQWLQKIVTEES